MSNDTSPNPSAELVEHAHHRVFIGPMPERVVVHTEAHARKHGHGLFHSAREEQAADDSQSVSHLLKEHAFTFFLRRGGKAENWGEAEEQSTLEEMMQRWKKSEWGSIWSHRQKQANQSSTFPGSWIGGSFEVGSVLGVNVLQDSASLRDRATDQLNRIPIQPETLVAGGDPDGDATRLAAQKSAATPVLHSSSVSGSSEPIATVSDASHASHSNSKSPLLETATASTSSPSFSGGQPKSKGRQVQYENDAPPATRETRCSQDVRISEVVSPRPTLPPPPSDKGEVVLRDRMLVRVSYTEEESPTPKFDEAQNRTARSLVYQDWAEFLVAWRHNRLELYEDYSVPGKEWITGHKHLAYVIPLKSPKTQLSLYSFVDMTFCLTCQPTSTRPNGSTLRWRFRKEKEGTNVFVFKLKCRSRAYDWTWLLWRYMGGNLPKAIEVRNPRLDTRVKIDIPSGPMDMEQLFKVFNRDNVISLCMDSLRAVNNWNALIEREILSGKTLELAWRVDTDLDWIWLEDDIEGKKRDWAVLCGLALRQSTSPAFLEIRLAEHYPDHFHLRNGKRLREPPAIEGYLERVKPNTQIKQQVYLTTHTGYLLSLPPTRAHPPTPPGLTPLNAGAKSLRAMEFQRGTMQLMDTIGVCDLKSILLIRRAFQAQPPHTHREKEPEADDIWFRLWSQPEERTVDDEEDQGGEEGLARLNDKTQCRMKRCFELLLKNGRVVRFEAHSRRVAVEWIERLRALVLYWKERQRVDAREEMDLAHSRRPRLTPRMHARVDDRELPPETPADAGGPMPALGWLYNWCVLDGCKSIIHGGKVYTRRGLRGQYKPVQMFLISGSIIQFRINPNSALHRPVHKKISLVDAYVCSGYLAALALPSGQYNANSGIAPRRYQDGLEADDAEEDMLFMVWYHPQGSAVDRAQGPLSTTPQALPKAITPLSAKRKILVCRTRSKIERDAWCWALNTEIEKVARAQKDRESRIRADGTLLQA
ncbi:hypothetical protein BDN72DRAFT_834437 [Pluteus cervinus]|uniref:Uncharacterized protein n=1 Tax=Pluteus cervinus TaxID=181527 RepID=A0ACD3B7A8_9AGAR|nr:hypothetical protein BDN72DRAFT_834437 [Pluteus cervinus]